MQSRLLNSTKKLITYLLKSAISLINGPSTIYDLTRPISSDVAVYPGDPDFKIEKVQEITKGSNYNLCYLHMGNHTGTHIDFPAHTFVDEKTSSNYKINAFIGKGVVVEVPENFDKKNLGITSEFIKLQNIQKNDIVFFKTSNSKIPSNKITDEYIYLTPNGADELINKQVKIMNYSSQPNGMARVSCFNTAKYQQLRTSASS